MNKTNQAWQIETRKGGAEVYVACGYYSIFIGEGYSAEEEEKSLRLANVIVIALNEYEEGFECHDRGSKRHMVVDDEPRISLQQS